VFDEAVARETDADKRANLELCREYFTNPEFRKALEGVIARINGVTS
jgi:hypothetical protein